MTKTATFQSCHHESIMAIQHSNDFQMDQFDRSGIGELEFEFCSTWNWSNKSLMYYSKIIYSEVHFQTPGSSRSILFFSHYFFKTSFFKIRFQKRSKIKVNVWSCISIFEEHSILRSSSEDITVTPVFLKHIVSYLEIQALVKKIISNDCHRPPFNLNIECAFGIAF